AFCKLIVLLNLFNQKRLYGAGRNRLWSVDIGNILGRSLKSKIASLSCSSFARESNRFLDSAPKPCGKKSTDGPT
ncbi:MAG: hypothetical protein AAGB01_00885, partial [Cyanobacteria bacterium P01_F01_bin.42]